MRGPIQPKPAAAENRSASRRWDFREGCYGVFRRKFLHLTAGAPALPAVSHIARAQSYPSRPVCMIVPGFISSELENASAHATIDDSTLLLGSQSDVASMRRLTAVSISRPQFSQDWCPEFDPAENRLRGWRERTRTQISAREPCI